ncbi:hypothetical protein [Ectobacillus panaciterrae]|uniref:hypothetical protein n=1 Tax=Ectobacillus panaciterrae TaxID=363872 RepID=UPI00040B5914|nr:hypothetical protein [Ectobacillus panaciterrae]
MLLSLSALIVFIYTTYLILKISFNEDKLENMTGMIAAMSLGMISGLTMGLILGIVFKNDLTTSTILAMILSLIVGYFVGKPISLLTIIEGMAAGVMGGMMGAMLGEMLPSGNFKIMLAFMDILYIIVVSLILLLINKELSRRSHKVTNFIHSYSSITIMVIVTIIICITAFYNGNPIKNQIHNNHVENHMNMNEHNHQNK